MGTRGLARSNVGLTRLRLRQSEPSPSRSAARSYSFTLPSSSRWSAAARAFFRKALKHHREPHSITLDGHRPSHSALRRMGMKVSSTSGARTRWTIRCCQYLNNVVEQDHRWVKGRLRPMLGFKAFYNARRVIIGIKLAAEDSQTPVRNSDHIPQ